MRNIRRSTSANYHINRLKQNNDHFEMQKMWLITFCINSCQYRYANQKSMETLLTK